MREHLVRCSDICLIVQRSEMLLQHTAAFTKMTPTAFISAMTSSGGTKADCRTFATETIKDIKQTVSSSQGTVHAIDTGSGCAALGQDEVQAEQAKVAAAKVVVQSAEAVVVSKTTAKNAAASATFEVTFDLMSTERPECVDITGQSSYQAVKNAREAAKDELRTAEQDVVAAKTAVTDAETALAGVVKEASRLMSGCLCSAHKAQKAAWAAVSTATDSHAADWKQAHDVICALDKTATCNVPTCPTVTQPTLAAGVANANSVHCTPEPTTAPTTAPTTCDANRCPASHPVCMGHHRALPYGRCAKSSWTCYGDGSCDSASYTIYPSPGHHCLRHNHIRDGRPLC
jgi:hypothetical protein